MQNINDLVSTLDRQALGVLSSFNFSDSPLAWGDELNQTFSVIYASMVRQMKEDIRVAVLGFRGQRRTAHLVHNLEDLASRTSMIRLMVSVVNLLTQHPSRLPPPEFQEISRLRAGTPDLSGMVRSILARFSGWQDEVQDAVDMFSILEAPEQTLENLLASVPDTIPLVYLSQGRDLMDQLVRLWAECRTVADQAAGLALGSEELQRLVDRLNNQRQDQEPILRSFGALILQAIDFPPFHLLENHFTSRQLIEANLLYRRLCARNNNLNEEIVFLESVLDRMLGVLDTIQE